MKRFKLVSMVVAVVLTVAAISCSPVRYDEGYDVGYSSNSAYYGVDPYIGYYTPSPYYAVPYYGGTYYSRGYNRGTVVRPSREYHGRDTRRYENNRQENHRQESRQQNTRVYQNRQTEQHIKGNPLIYMQQHKRN